MSIYLQFPDDALSRLITAVVQETVDTTNLPYRDTPAGRMYVDHINVEPPSFRALSAEEDPEAKTLRIDIPLVIFLTSQEEAMKNPNATAPGTLVPRGTLRLLLDLVVGLTDFRIQYNSTIPPLGTFLGASVEKTLQEKLAKLPSADLAGVFDSMELLRPQRNGHLKKLDDSVMIVLGPITVDIVEIGQVLETPVVLPAEDFESHVFFQYPGADWIVGFSPQLMAAMFRVRFAPVAKQMDDNGVKTTSSGVRWVAGRTAGDTPTVSVTLNCIYGIVPLQLNFVTTIHLAPGGASGGHDLVMSVKWDFDVTWVDPLLTKLLFKLVGEGITKANIHRRFEGTGDHRFEIRTPLPAFKFAGIAADLTTSLIGFKDAMTLAGTLTTGITPDPLTLTVLDVRRAPGAYGRAVFCTGASPVPKATEYSLTTSFQLQHRGSPRASIGGITFTSFPGESGLLQANIYYDWSRDGRVVTISLRLSADLGARLAVEYPSAGIQLLVQCPRGLRFVDLGPLPKLPPANLDFIPTLGGVSGPESPKSQISKWVRDIFAANCPMAEDPIRRLLRRGFPVFDLPYPQPVRWQDRVHAVPLFESTLVRLGDIGLGVAVSTAEVIDPAATRAVFALAPSAAAAAGSASAALLVPSVLPYRSQQDGASIERLDGAALGAVRTRSKVFARVAVVAAPGAVLHTISDFGTSTGAGRWATTALDNELPMAALESLMADGSVRRTLLDGAGSIIPAGGGGGVGVKLADHRPRAAIAARYKPRGSRCDEGEDSDDSTNDGRDGGEEITPGPGASADEYVAFVAAQWTPAAAKSVGLPGMVALHSVPGFEDDDVAVAAMDDGSFRSVMLTGGKSWAGLMSAVEIGEKGVVAAPDSSRLGTRLVATGSLPSWPSLPPATPGGWAISSTTGDRVTVFRVRDLGLDIGGDGEPSQPDRWGMTTRGDRGGDKCNCGCKG